MYEGKNYSVLVVNSFFMCSQTVVLTGAVFCGIRNNNLFVIPVIRPTCIGILLLFFSTQTVFAKPKVIKPKTDLAYFLFLETTSKVNSNMSKQTDWETLEYRNTYYTEQYVREKIEKYCDAGTKNDLAELTKLYAIGPLGLEDGLQVHILETNLAYSAYFSFCPQNKAAFNTIILTD
jgi:hypothetical protein